MSGAAVVEVRELAGMSTGIDAAAGVIDDLLGFAVNRSGAHHRQPARRRVLWRSDSGT
jgi:hypothetical protein